MHDGHITRRDFLRRGGTAAGWAALTLAGAGALHTTGGRAGARRAEDPIRRDLRRTGLSPSMVVATGDDPAAMFRAAVAAAGGMGAFIGKGESVVVKPNIGWDRAPEQAANTHPALVAEIVRQCYTAGASRVVVTDVTCNDAHRCFNRSGIAQAAQEAGAEVRIPAEGDFRTVHTGGDMLGRQPVLRAFLDADRVINVPIAKHHGLTRVTLGMKNLYGILGGNRSRLHQDIHQSIADLANFLRPTLVVMDGYRILLRNGPQGGSLDDVALRRTLALSVDPVAIDAWAGETLFDMTPADMPWLAAAEAYGLGTSDHRSLPLVTVAA